MVLLRGVCTPHGYYGLFSAFSIPFGTGLMLPGARQLRHCKPLDSTGVPDFTYFTRSVDGISPLFIVRLPVFPSCLPRFQYRFELYALKSGAGRSDTYYHRRCLVTLRPGLVKVGTPVDFAAMAGVAPATCGHAIIALHRSTAELHSFRYIDWNSKVLISSYSLCFDSKAQNIMPKSVCRSGRTCLA